MELIELVLATAIGEAGEYQDVRLSKEDANVILGMLTAQQKWISVKDRLPEEDTDVLVANGLGIEIAAYTTNPVKQWYGMNGQDVYVKYWMPLPEPPKEGKDE